jgi:hypothetical protein
VESGLKIKMAEWVPDHKQYEPISLVGSNPRLTGNVVDMLFIFKEYENGGEGGIRTHGTDKGPLVFKTSAFDHSATSPSGARGYMIISRRKRRMR